MASPINVGQAVIIGPSNPRHHFEISGSLMYLQPGAGDLEYGTLITPLPITSPNWASQSLKPGFSPSFRVGARYMPSEADDIELNWTHLNNTANGAFSAAPTQMVGPPYLIGPESALYQNANGRCDRPMMPSIWTAVIPSVPTVSVPIARLRRRGVCSHRPDYDRAVSERRWHGCQRIYQQLAVYRRWTTVGIERSVCLRRLSIHQASWPGRA